MNMPMQQGGPMGMNPMAMNPANPVQLSPAQHPGMHPGQGPPMQQPQQPPPQEKIDNISRAKMLMGPLRDTLSVALKTAAQTLHQNSLIDTSKGTDAPDQRFNKHIEEFYAVCDQIEIHLRTASEIFSQHSSSGRYMPVNVNPVKIENIGAQDALTYPQYLMTVRTQINYVRDIYDMLLSTARTINPTE